jgi:hypothetical protein
MVVCSDVRFINQPNINAVSLPIPYLILIIKYSSWLSLDARTLTYFRNGAAIYNESSHQ